MGDVSMVKAINFASPFPQKKRCSKKLTNSTQKRVSEALADYFGKPVDTFMKKPEYAGKPIRCWEYPLRSAELSCV